MKGLKMKIATVIMALGILSVGQEASAAVHVVKPGDTLWKISSQYGVKLSNLLSLNRISNHIIYPGQRIVVPASISQADKDLLARLVHAEAKGESYSGKVAVATVVLNRVDHRDFPNTIRSVIYQVSNGFYAFSPVANGQINKPADQEAYRAVNEALAFRGQGKGSLYFYNPKIITNKWILSREVTTTIGNHVFAK